MMLIAQRHFRKPLFFLLGTIVLFSLFPLFRTLANSDTVSIDILNPYSHPKTGDVWKISFTTTGTADLLIAPHDEATREDLTFEGLYCRGMNSAEPVFIDNKTQSVSRYSCDGVSSIHFLVNQAGDHSITIQFGDQRVTAHNSGVFQWSKILQGENNNDYGKSVATDTDDRIIVAGTVTGSADLNGDGDTTDPYEGAGYGNDDIFFSVFDSTGTFAWSKRLGGTGSDYRASVTTDTDDRIIVAGTVTDSSDLNGDGDTTDTNEATGYGESDVIISVFDSAGTFVFSKRMGGSQWDDGFSVATDTDDRIIVAGTVVGSADLNGDGDTTDTYEGTGYGNNDAFFSVFGSTGTYAWSKRLGGTPDDTTFSVTTDGADLIVIAGETRNEADLNGDGDTTDRNEDPAGETGNDAFISVFNASGSHCWSERLGGLSNDTAYSVTADTANNVIVAGMLLLPADLNGDGDMTDPNEGATGESYGDVFIVAFSPDTVPPIPSSFLPPSGSIIADPTPSISFILDEAGDCKVSSTDKSYDNMIDDTDCTGDGGISMLCAIPDLGLDGEKSLFVSCRDSSGNKDTAETNELLTYTLYTVPPIPSEFSPASFSTITNRNPTITFSLNQSGDCRAGTHDESYDDMSDDDDCIGDGTTTISCTLSEFPTNEEIEVFISCRGTAGTQDTAETNEHLVYSLVDTNSPESSSFSPPSGSHVQSLTPFISFLTDEKSSCRISLSDGSYDDMTLECDGDSSYSHWCITPNLETPGSKAIYISCSDLIGNKDSSESNTDLTYQVISRGVVPPQFLNSFRDEDVSPNGFVVDFEGNIFVSDLSNNSVNKYGSDGTFMLSWGGSGDDPGMFDSPGGISTDSVGNVYVTDINNNRIQKFESDGEFLLQWGESGEDEGKFSSPRDLAVDFHGNVYVLDSDNNRIQKFTPEGEYLDQWEVSCSSSSLDVDYYGNTYVACNNSFPALFKYDSEGTEVLSLGSDGVGQGEFSEGARFVVVDRSGFVYITDMIRIQKFDSDGSFATMWGNYGIANGAFRNLSFISVDSNENIYSVDDTCRFQKFGYSNTIIEGYSSSDRPVSPSDPGMLDEFGLSFLEDERYWSTSLSVENFGYDSQVFKIDPNKGNIVNPTFDISWTGHGDEPELTQVYLAIWNFETLVWESLSSQHCADDCTLSGIRTGDEYMDTEGYVWLWAKADNEYSAPPEITFVETGYPPEIYWETDIESTTHVVFDTESHSEGGWEDYEYQTVHDKNLTSEHQVFLTIPIGIWYFRLRSCTEGDNCVISEEYSFDYGGSSSCPFIFSYDGSRFIYHVDASSSGILSMGLDLEKWAENPFYKTSRNYPHPLSYTWISGESLVPRSNGGETYYDIRNTSELNEVNYFDAASLYILDHSPEVEIYPDYRENGQFHTMRKNAAAPVRVLDQDGTDVSQLVSSNDGIYLHSRRGSAPSFIDIKLSNNETTPDHLKLLIERSMEGSGSGGTGNNALQYKNSEGTFVDVPDEYNIFEVTREGAPKSTQMKATVHGMDSKVIDLTGLQILDNTIRLVMTNENRQWNIDWLAVDTSPDEEIVVSEQLAYYANLQFRGVSRMVLTAPDDPLMKLQHPIYEDLDMYYPSPLSGMATRYGDVTELVGTVDNKYVVMTQGDEITFRYGVPEQTPGTERDFIYMVFDYHKPDRSALGNTIDLLPFEGMSQYPYDSTVENYPYEELQGYLEAYNTRSVDWGLPELLPNMNLSMTHHSLNTDFCTIAAYDETPPTVVITEAHSGTTNDPTPIFRATATEESGTISKGQFQVDGGSWIDCLPDDDEFNEKVEAFSCSISPALTDGNHTVRIRASDSNGNYSEVIGPYSLFLDSTAPTSVFTEAPSGITHDPTPTFKGTAADESGTVSKVQYQVDGEEWKDCSADDGAFDEAVEDFSCTVSPALSDGEHTIRIRALDSIGNYSGVLGLFTLTLSTKLEETGEAALFLMIAGAFFLGTTVIRMKIERRNGLRSVIGNQRKT